MKFDLKTLWASMTQTEKRDEAKEFINIKDWINAHDSGFKPWTLLNTAGSLTFGAQSKTSSYTLGTSDAVLLVDSTTAAITITLPDATGITGRLYVVMYWKGTHLVTIATSASQTINGAATVVLPAQYTVAGLVSDGANWVKIF